MDESQSGNESALASNFANSDLVKILHLYDFEKSVHEVRINCEAAIRRYQFLASNPQVGLQRDVGADPVDNIPTLPNSVLITRLFVTTRGFCGESASGIAPGDTVAVIPGGLGPFILRRNADTGRFVLVKVANILGIDVAQVLTDRADELQAIEIE